MLHILTWLCLCLYIKALCSSTIPSRGFPGVLHCCHSLSGSCAALSQYMASASLMLPNDKLKVLPSLLVTPLPSLFFFLFQFNKEAELWPLPPPSRCCRVFSLSLQWDSMMALLSTCKHTQVKYRSHLRTHIETAALDIPNTHTHTHTHTYTYTHTHTYLPVIHVSVVWPHWAPLFCRCSSSACWPPRHVWPIYSPVCLLLQCSLLPSVPPPKNTQTSCVNH